MGLKMVVIEDLKTRRSVVYTNSTPQVNSKKGNTTTNISQYKEFLAVSSVLGIVLFIAVIAALGKKLHNRLKTGKDSKKQAQRHNNQNAGSYSEDSMGSVASSLESISEDADVRHEGMEPVLTEDGQVMSHDFVTPSEDYGDIPLYSNRNLLRLKKPTAGYENLPKVYNHTNNNEVTEEESEDYEFISGPMLFKRVSSAPCNLKQYTARERYQPYENQDVVDSQTSTDIYFAEESNLESSLNCIAPGLYVRDPRLVDETVIYGNISDFCKTLPSKLGQKTRQEQYKAMQASTLPPTVCPGIYVHGAQVVDLTDTEDQKTEQLDSDQITNTPPLPCLSSCSQPDVAVYVTNAYHLDGGKRFSRTMSHEPETNNKLDSLQSRIDFCPKSLSSSLPANTPPHFKSETCLQCQRSLNTAKGLPISLSKRLCAQCTGVYVVDAEYIRLDEGSNPDKVIAPRVQHNSAPSQVSHPNSDKLAIAERSKILSKPIPKPRRTSMPKQIIYQNEA